MEQCFVYKNTKKDLVKFATQDLSGNTFKKWKTAFKTPTQNVCFRLW